MTHHHLTMESPVGELLLTAEDDELTGLYLAAEQRAPEPGSTAGGPFLTGVRDQLAGYFGGSLRAFDIAVAPAGTAWQRRVWDELARIPFGETITYAELARRADNPTAIRAAGAANGQNPISIVDSVPSRDRYRRAADRVLRWARREAVAARPRGRGAMSPVTLYDYPASANCLKARMLLALLGQPYERVETDIFAGATLTDAFGRSTRPARRRCW